MKVRGTLRITKNLIVPGPNGTVGAQGLVATSDANGSLYWGRFYILDVDESLTYRKGTMVMVGEKAYIAKIDNASGVTPLNLTQWLELGEAGTGGTQLTQAQLDAINGANAPSGSNPFATLADIYNLTLVGTDTIENIVLKNPSPPNNMWISSTAGLDSAGSPVLVGDGIVSDGADWLNIGPMRGPQGEQGPPGAGTEIVGSDTVANILLKDPVAGENTLWIATDDGIDDASNPVVAGDGLVSDGTDWLGVGAVRGPQGDKGDKGDPGASEYSGTYLIKGGIEWLSGYQYRVTADKYVIAGILYGAAPVIITLGSADPVLDRTDTFVANFAGLIYVKTDTLAVNEAIEVKISQVTVVANTTVDPAITGSVIYDEQSGGEWVASVIATNGASVDLAFVGDFISGGQSTRVLNGRTVTIQYLAPAPITVANTFSVLTFRMKSLLTTSNATVTMAFHSAGVKASTSLNVADYGYDYTNNTDWQYISMYTNYFGILTADVDELVLSIDDPTLSQKSEFLIDIIGYQHGVYMPPPDGAVPEYTSQLINNGDTGAFPFATVDQLGLQSVTDIEATTTNTIIVDAGGTDSVEVRTAEVSVVALDVTTDSIIYRANEIAFAKDLTATASLTNLAAQDHDLAPANVLLPTVSGTLALQSDIAAVGLTEVLTVNNSASNLSLILTGNDVGGGVPTTTLGSSDVVFEDNIYSIRIQEDAILFSKKSTGFSTRLTGLATPDLTQNIVVTMPGEGGQLALKSDIATSTGTYVHTEGGALATWNINHNLGKYPSVMVVDTGKNTIDAVVTYVDTDNITITLAPASAGYAYLN